MKHALTRLVAVALVAGGVVGVVNVAQAGPQQAPVAATTCVKPTGSITNQKMLDYNACRFDEILAALPVTATPTPSPTPTPTPS